MMPSASRLRCRATGVTFAPGYPGNLADIVRRCAIEGPIAVELVRDVDNYEDLNAISVRLEGRHLGWVPADFAAFIAPQIDAGASWTGNAMCVAIHPEHRDRPGLELHLNREGPA